MPRKKKSDLYEREDLAVDKDAAVSRVLQDFKSDEDSRTQREAMWKTADSMYYGLLKEKTEPWPGCSNMAHPIPRIVCDTMTDNLAHSFPANIDLIRAVPVSNDDHVKATKRGEFLNYQFKQEVKWEDIKQDLFQIAVRYGDCFTKQYYDIQEREKTDKEIETELSTIEADENGNIPEIDPMVTTFHGIRMDVLNIEDVYKPADSIGIQADSCSHVGLHIRISRPEYEYRVANQDYTPIDFNDSKKTSDKDYSLIGTNDENRKNIIGISKRLQDDAYRVNLVEWYGAFYNEKAKKWEEVVFVVHPSSRTLCKAYINRLGFRPIVQHSPKTNANQPYHDGYCEIIKHLANYLNTVYNQRRDSEAKRIAQPGFYDSGSKFSPKNYLLKPLGMYPTQGPPSNSIYFPQFQGAPPELFNEEQIIKRLIEELTGISDPIKGATSSGDKSATEIAHVVNRFNIRFESVYARFERSLMEVVEQCNELNRQYMPEEKEYRVLGHNGKFSYTSISRSEMEDRFDVVFKGNNVASDVAEQQKAMQVYQIGVGNPLIANNPLFLYNQLKRLYSSLHVERIDELVPTPVQALTRTPFEEHELMYKGIMVPVQLNENAEEHWSMHRQEMDAIGWQEKTPIEVQALFNMHIESTNSLKAAQLTARQSGAQTTVGPSEINASNTAPAAPVGGAPAKPIRQK